MAKRLRGTKDPGSVAKTSRFSFDLDDDDFEQLSRGFVPENTAADTQKYLKLFQDWVEERNSRFPEHKVLENILLSDDLRELCKWLCRFCTEIRKKDGSRYPPRTIHHYLMGIQRHIRVEKKSSVNIISQSEFVPLKKLLDVLYRKLHSEGLGCSLQKNEAVSDEDEEQFGLNVFLIQRHPRVSSIVFFSSMEKTSVYAVGLSIVT